MTELSKPSMRAHDRYVVGTWNDGFRLQVHREILRAVGARTRTVDSLEAEVRWTPTVVRQGLQSLIDKGFLELVERESRQHRLAVRKIR